jgi:hypothetical protein
MAVCGLIGLAIKEMMHLKSIGGGREVPDEIYKVEGILMRVFWATLGGFLLGTARIA